MGKDEQHRLPLDDPPFLFPMPGSHKTGAKIAAGASGYDVADVGYRQTAPSQPTMSYAPQSQPPPSAMPNYPTFNMQPYSQASSSSSTSYGVTIPQASTSTAQTTPVTADDPLGAFLSQMPAGTDEASRQAMWTQLVQLKTKALDLEIAEAKRKEKEAELELARLTHGASPLIRRESGVSTTTVPGTPQVYSTSGQYMSQAPMQSISTATSQQQQQQQQYSNFQSGSSTQQATPTWQTFPLVQHAVPIVDNPPEPSQMYPTPMTPFDLEAMIQGANLDNLFDWLPEHPGPSNSGQSGQRQPSTVNTADLHPAFGSGPTMSSPEKGDGLDLLLEDIKPGYGLDFTTPSTAKRRASSIESAASDTHTKRPKRAEKKLVVEQHVSCTHCHSSLGRFIVRAPKPLMPSPIIPVIRCLRCSKVEVPPALPDPSTSGSAIGTVESRKRMRTAIESEDDAVPDQMKRIFCDVCQRVYGSGSIAGGADQQSLAHISEMICETCDHKYQRCTDCGGGGGPRTGIGKWRLKQVFQPGRKTCSLSHTRVGDRPREIGVHITPTEFTPEQLREVLAKCKVLWNEKSLGRMAVPEMLEIDLPAHLINPIRNFGDIEEIISRNWPTREAMIKAEDADPDKCKRVLGLIWVHTRPRRSIRTVDLEGEFQKAIDEQEDEDNSTVLANVKRTQVAIPAGSELIGMWGGEWDMNHGSLLISTFIPFEGTDGEDSTALSVGEMITKVQSLRVEINAQREAEAKQTGIPAKLVPQCEHLWTVSGGTMPLVRERMADILVRKRSFVHVDEYLTRHPDFIEALKARPLGLHPSMAAPLRHQAEQDPEYHPEPLILVRWLGKDFDAQKVLEIKQMEFGGKKLKKRPKSRV